MLNRWSGPIWCQALSDLNLKIKIEVSLVTKISYPIPNFFLQLLDIKISHTMHQFYMKNTDRNHTNKAYLIN